MLVFLIRRLDGTGANSRLKALLVHFIRLLVHCRCFRGTRSGLDRAGVRGTGARLVATGVAQRLYVPPVGGGDEIHPFWMCKVRCWRWLFGNEMPISLSLRRESSARSAHVPGRRATHHLIQRRRGRSNPSGKCSQERLTRGTETSTMRRAAHPSGRARCGAGAGCSAIKYQSRCPSGGSLPLAAHKFQAGAQPIS